LIATQELVKWHEKHTARGPLIGELAKQQEKYAMQDPGTASQEPAKWQRNLCNKRSGNSQTWKQDRRNKRDCQTFSQRRKKQKKPTNSNLDNQELSNKYNVTLAN
jgi:hypothetical protein